MKAVASAGVVAAMAVAGSASGAFVQLDRKVSVEYDAAVSVELYGAFAGAEGDLYFLGASVLGEGGMAFAASADTGEPGFGMKLFSNKAAAGTRAEIGDFAAGSELYFGYVITKGSGDVVALGDVFRSDALGDQVQFGYDEAASVGGMFRLGWEDVRDPKRSDWDYNDAMFDVTFTPARGAVVPAPGSALLLGFGGALAARRRCRG